MQIEQEIIKRKKIIMPLFVIIFILSSFVFVKFLLNRMNTYIEVNGEISMEAVVEQIHAPELSRGLRRIGRQLLVREVNP